MLLSVKNEKWSGLWTIANTGESWFGCQWDDRQIYLQTAILANFSTNDSLGEALLVTSKETVGISWDISSAILGHKYHRNHSNRSSEWSQHLQQKWLIQSVNGWVDQLFYWHQHSGSLHGYSEIRSRSNVWKDTEGHIYDYTHFLLQILGLFVSYTLGKWLQKEDIAETAVHFVLKWGFEVNPVSNNSMMLETEDLGDIASAYMPLKRGL